MKEVTLEMVCDLDDVELGQRAQALSLTTLKIDEVEDNKTTVNKEFKEELSGLREQARKLSRTLRSRSEVRPVVCFVVYHSPVQGTKRLIRKDTGELYRDEPMTSQEMQANLFEDTNLQDLAAEVRKAGLTGTVLTVLDAMKSERDIQ